jgi:hypothetical protein
MTTTGNTSSELDGHEVRPGRVAAAVALMALAAIVALGWALQQPPAPVPASAPARSSAPNARTRTCSASLAQSRRQSGVSAVMPFAIISWLPCLLPGSTSRFRPV